MNLTLKQKKIIDSSLKKLSNSKFRNSFHLKKKEISYIEEKGLRVIEEHARNFVEKRLTPANILNDGKQTPMKGHPVFLAQHATATCCRGCMEKWHHIKANTELSKEQQNYVVALIMEWIIRQTEIR